MFQAVVDYFQLGVVNALCIWMWPISNIVEDEKDWLQIIQTLSLD